mmetsp:Transcript_12880/g.29148  ORF Transcript_12880/g.29148 Transcript_12880/m.29148 type:complete len:211 (-) Transcript_12880:7-639(-)
MLGRYSRNFSVVKRPLVYVLGESSSALRSSVSASVHVSRNDSTCRASKARKDSKASQLNFGTNISSPRPCWRKGESYAACVRLTKSSPVPNHGFGKLALCTRKFRKVRLYSEALAAQLLPSRSLWHLRSKTSNGLSTFGLATAWFPDTFASCTVCWRSVFDVVCSHVGLQVLSLKSTDWHTASRDVAVMHTSNRGSIKVVYTVSSRRSHS